MTAVRTRALPALLRIVLAPAFWLERARGRWRLALGGFYSLLLVAACVLGWRETRLWELPDIGDPFETKPLLSLSVPDDRNAFVLFAKACALAKRSPQVERRLFVAPYGWPAPTDKDGQQYMADNAEAIAVWLEGCDRPDALYTPPSKITFTSPFPVVQEHRDFARLALMEGSRRQAAGDMAGAWQVYRAALRGSRLVPRHGTIIAALVGIAEYAVIAPQVYTWAADPRVDAAQLRRALDDVRAINALTVPPSQVLQVEYLCAIRGVTDRRWLLDMVQKPPDGNELIDKTAWYNHLQSYWRARWFMAHEPEQSRRLLRMAYANWLAHCDDSPDRRPPLVGSINTPRGAIAGQFYDDIQPPGSISPTELSRRVRHAMLTDMVLFNYPTVATAFDRDRGTRASLVVQLASHLYEKQFGKSPASVDALIGPCLDRLPDGYVRVDDADPPKPAAKSP